MQHKNIEFIYLKNRLTNTSQSLIFHLRSQAIFRQKTFSFNLFLIKSYKLHSLLYLLLLVPLYIYLKFILNKMLLNRFSVVASNDMELFKTYANACHAIAVVITFFSLAYISLIISAGKLTVFDCSSMYFLSSRCIGVQLLLLCWLHNLSATFKHTRQLWQICWFALWQRTQEGKEEEQEEQEEEACNPKLRSNFHVIW